MRLMDYPNMKDDDRRSWHRDIHRLAYPKTWDTSEPLSPEKAAERLRSLLNG